MNIIIIDDEPKIRNGMKNLLSRSDRWTVAGVFENAKEALHFLANETTDVIITDIRMPEMSGLELIARLRETNTEARIIILSGYSDFRYAQKAVELGVYRYLVKPTNPRELMEILESIERKLGEERGTEKEEKTEIKNLIVKKSIDYIELNYSQKIMLKEIAEELYVSPNYLSELFKKHMGKNISEFITDFRLEKSKKYLGKVEYTVAEVAELTGIGNARYFSNLFKKKYGMTPSEYRNKII